MFAALLGWQGVETLPAPCAVLPVQVVVSTAVDPTLVREDLIQASRFWRNQGVCLVHAGGRGTALERLFPNEPLAGRRVEQAVEDQLRRALSVLPTREAVQVVFLPSLLETGSPAEWWLADLEGLAVVPGTTVAEEVGCTDHAVVFVRALPGDGPTLAHELGHVFGLGHQRGADRLMDPAAHGSERGLDDEERSRVARFFAGS